MWRGVSWGVEGGSLEDYCAGEKNTRQGKEEGREREGEAWKGVGGAAALQSSLCWAVGRRIPVTGRMFWPRAAGQWEARAGPLGRGRARAGRVWLNLKSVFAGCLSFFAEGSFLFYSHGCADAQDEDPGVARHL